VIVIFRIVLVCASLVLLMGGTAHSDPYEEILKDVDDEQEYLDLLNQLDTIVREPVNLLEADRAELARLPWVSPWLATEIVALRRKGQLAVLDDLAKIDGVDRELIDLLRPFVVVRPPGKAGARVGASLRMRVVASPVSSSYDGVKTYIRSQVNYGPFDTGLLAEKDRDETRFNDLQTGYGRWQFPGVRLVVGDFLMTSGHGLVFSDPYGFSPSTVEPWRFSQGDFGVKPYTSVDENFAMRGVGIQVGGRRTGVSAAVSRSRLDASIDDDGRVASIGTTGLHPPGTGGRGALREDLAGLAVRTMLGRFGVGLDVVVARFDHDFAIARLGHLGRAWKSAGGIDLSYLGESSTAFTEGARADGGDGAALAGFGYDGRGIEFLLLARYYGESYFSFHARPFGFYSGPATGERGLLARIAFRLPEGIRLSVGSDLHDRRPEEDGLARPSGYESFLDVELPAGDFKISAGGKIRATREPPAHEADPTTDRSRLRARLDVAYRAARWFDVRLRYENLRYREDAGSDRERTSSDLLRLDLAAKIGRRVNAKTGFQSFTIGSYGARLYQYEPGVPYYPAIEMLKSDGSRWYSVLSFDMSPWGKIATKYAVTVYGDGTGRSQFLCYYSVKR
jgi:hypothetical protein